jgi:hypothetical protein
MLEDLDNESKYLESIDNGEENLEIRLENLKKNDWKRMNSIGENDNRLGLVHMGFECSIHDIYDPDFTDNSENKSERTQGEISWKEEALWESEDEQKTQVVNTRTLRRGRSRTIKRLCPDSKTKRRWRFSVGDKGNYQKVQDSKLGTNPEFEELYRDVKSRFSDFYDIEFIEQVWNMREMRGNVLSSKVPPRTPSPKKMKKGFMDNSGNSQLNGSRNLNRADSLTIKLSCINNPKSEMGSEWNESLMGILEDFSIGRDKYTSLGNPHAVKTKETHSGQNNSLGFGVQRKSYPNIVSEKLRFKKPKMQVDLNDEVGFQIENDTNLNYSNKKRFRKRKGISGTNSLSEMTGLLEDDLSNLMPELVENLGLFNNKVQKVSGIDSEKKPEVMREIPGQELIHLTTQTSKNWEMESKLPTPMNGTMTKSKSIVNEEERAEDKDTHIGKGKWPKDSQLNLENISEKIMEVASKKALFEKESKTDRLSHREMAVSTERGLNFLIENWKELGTLQNPPNTLEKFSARKDPKSNTKSKKKRDSEIEKVQTFPSKFRKKSETVSQLNPDNLRADCFIKKPKEGKTEGTKSIPKVALSQKKYSNPGPTKLKQNQKEVHNENDCRSVNKKQPSSPSKKSTPQNGKKVQVPLLKYPFSNFYLPNAKKIFAKSTVNFSKTQKQSSGTANLIPGTPKTISDNFILETNPPKSHRQFSNKKRLRNDALKKKIKMNSKKKNSKELQKILEMKKNLVNGKKVDGKIQDSLRRLKSKKMESKAFQSDRNLSVQKSKYLPLF